MSEANLERWPDYERQSWQQRFAELDRQYRILQSRAAQRIQELQTLASEREAIGRAAGREEAARAMTILQEGLSSAIAGPAHPAGWRVRRLSDTIREAIRFLAALPVDGGKDGA